MLKTSLYLGSKHCNTKKNGIGNVTMSYIRVGFNSALYNDAVLLHGNTGSGVMLV